MEKVSFVIPCYKSSKTIEKVVDEIESTMMQFKNVYNYEIILVNDFPQDETFNVIKKIAKTRSNVIGINLAKNFGQHAALMAGFHYCTGDITVCLDDDGQTPANEVGKLLEKLDEGYDVVYAKYSHKQHSLFRNLGSKVNNSMARVMIGKPKDLYISSYFCARKFVIQEMIKYHNCFPYVIGLVIRTTKNIGNVEVTHRKREVGNSGYTFGKLIKLWLNGFTAFSIKPLRLATICGSVCALLGFLYGIYVIIKKLTNPKILVGWSSTIAVIMFIGGMLMLMLGLIGEYIGRIYISINDSPQYVIRETTKSNKI